MGYLIDTRPDEDTFGITPLDEQLDDLDDSEIAELSAAVQEQMEKRELAPPAEDKTEEPTNSAALIQDAFNTLADAMSGSDDRLAVDAARVVITSADEVGKCAEILMLCQGGSKENAS